MGELTKDAVRSYARQRGLPVADKPDSQEICFVPDGDYAQFVERQLPQSAGAGVITDTTGRVLGRHDGVHHYTVGQRKGLRLTSTEPLYVLELRPDDRAVVVGPRDALDRATCDVADVNWTAGVAPDGPIRASSADPSPPRPRSRARDPPGRRSSDDRLRRAGARRKPRPGSSLL